MTHQQRRLVAYGLISSRIPSTILDAEYDLERQEALAASDTLAAPHACTRRGDDGICDAPCISCDSALAEAQAEAESIRRQRMRVIREMQRIVGHRPLVAVDA